MGKVSSDRDNLAIDTGINNLLVNCAGLSGADTLLIAVEDPALGWYDQAVSEAVIAGARALGISPTIVRVGAPTNQPHDELEAARIAHDCTIYLTRIGDQDRFGNGLPGRRSVMCYLRDLDMLASPYATTTYGALRSLKDAVDAAVRSARSIRITCPLGTDLIGVRPDDHAAVTDDVSVLRFPLGVPTPVEAATFDGRVALARFLTPTGSRVYDPPSLAIDGTCFVSVRAGRIVEFSGDAIQVHKIRAHYDMVASQFQIDGDAVHSWHAGIHPACLYAEPAANNPDRWSNTAFCSPRFVHFHTCGAQAPAEISWMVLDPTITLDGLPMWDRGRLMPDAFPETRQALVQWPDLVPLMSSPTRSVGVVEPV